MKSSLEFPGLHEELGVPDELGCLMLDTDRAMDLSVPDADLYVDPNEPYVNGLVDTPHVTIRNGFLPNVKRSHVDTVLHGMPVPRRLTVSGVANFGVDGVFDCVVLLVTSAPLTRMHRQLGVLPNVLTFPEYRPHVTLGFFQPGWFDDHEIYLWKQLGTVIKTRGFNYGNTLVADEVK